MTIGHKMKLQKEKESKKDGEGRKVDSKTPMGVFHPWAFAPCPIPDRNREDEDQL